MIQRQKNVLMWEEQTELGREDSQNARASLG